MRVLATSRVHHHPQVPKDGTDLLRLSQDYDVHISLRQKPMALRVEGTRAAVRQLTEHVLETKKVRQITICSRAYSRFQL